MKGAVLLQLNDDDTILVQAQIPIDAEKARVLHFAFDYEDSAAAMEKAKEQLDKIRASFVDPFASKPKIETLQ